MAGKINSFKELIVWQKSRLLVKEIYLISEKFPDKDKFGLTNQLRRAAVSNHLTYQRVTGALQNLITDIFCQYPMDQQQSLKPSLFLRMI